MTFVAQGEEDKLFKRMEENIGITIDALPGTDKFSNFLAACTGLGKLPIPNTGTYWCGSE